MRFKKCEIKANHRITQNEFEHFKSNLEKYCANLKNNLNKNGEDGFVGNALLSFLEECGFKDQTHIKYKQKGNSAIDLCLMSDSKPKVIFEAKKPQSTEFIKDDNILCKALYESILYLFRELESSNFNISYIILTNFKKFYIFDAKEFKNLFCENKAIKQLWIDFNNKNSLMDDTTQHFYDELEKILTNESRDSTKHIHGIYLNIDDLRNDRIYKDFYTVFNRDFLYKESRPNDANVLNQRFYNELLYILGLEEITQNGKVLIKPSNKSKGSLYANIITSMESSVLDSNEIDENALALLIIWLNRILFLKLIESNLISFNNDKNLAFLNTEKIPDFNALQVLFFDILAVELNKRSNTEATKRFTYLPYLNSSLFEKQDIEKKSLEIKNLDDNMEIPYYAQTQIKDSNGKKKSGKVKILKYLFDFLDSFDFGISDETQDVINQKELISSSVLGLVFEKLNGYKDGSFYTPNFITSYIVRDCLHKIVLEQFRQNFGINRENIDDLGEVVLKNINADSNFKNQAINVLNSIRICDPAVGSGHFLVSALNEMIYIYSKLYLLDFPYDSLDVENDEIMLKIDNKYFEYKRPKSESRAHKIQKSLFNLKKDIIENNLFGVDINPNSVEICRLRLWIELLKNSYYLDFVDSNFHNLNTLPNIDINIKCGNSLIRRYDLEDSLSKKIPNIKNQIDDYKNLVRDYKNADQITNISKEDLKNKIKKIKETFNLTLKDPKTKKALEKALEEHITLYNDFALDDESLLDGLSYMWNIFGTPNLNQNDKEKAYESFGKIATLRKKLDFTLSGEEYKSALEWRFEFPEVLDSNGDFKGFDLVIGNPPYIRQEEIKELKPQLQKRFRIFKGTSDIYTYFFELGFDLLKDNGILSFITSNKFTRAGYGELLRTFLLENTTILEFIDLNGKKVFKNASVDTSILSFKKAQPKDSTFSYKELNDKHLNESSLIDLSTLQTILLKQDSLNKEAFIFGDEKLLHLKAKIESIGTPLKDWDISINYGIKTGLNEAFIITSAKREEILNKCDDKIKDSNNLTEKERTSNLIKPILRGRDIKRYGYEWANLWIIATFPALKLNIEHYPVLKSYLESFMPKIEQSGIKNIDGIKGNNARKKTNNKWFETQDNIAYHNEFAKQKIVYPNMAKEFIAYFDTEGFFTNQKCFIITSNNIRQNGALLYLTAILNSKVNFWYFKQIGATLGASGYEMSKIFVENLPVPKIDSKNKNLANEIIKIVNKILESKKLDSNFDTTNLESNIDNLVYKLYNLDSNEIAIIEGKT